MMQLTHYEKGLDLEPFDEATATTMKGCFTTFRHHQKFDEDIAGDVITPACGTLHEAATDLGKGAESGKVITTPRHAWRAWQLQSHLPQATAITVFIINFI
jgi:hypothetical protein